MGATSSNFTHKELACKHCGLNNCKQVLVNALEYFRALVGKPVKVHNAYRCPTHNAAIGGAANSQHVLGLAADISVAGLDARDLERIAGFTPNIKGIGVDEHQNYIHVDCRIVPAKWCYDEKGKWIKYYGSGSKQDKEPDSGSTEG